VIIYRLTLHPLAKYPGPFLAKFTDIYLAYYAWKGSRHLAFHRAHEQYGSYVRLGPNLLSVNTATGLKTIYGFRANVRKASFYEAFPSTPKAVSVHSAIDKQQHARKRRVMSHAFSDQAIKSLEKYILANVRVGCELLGTRTGGGVSEKGRDNKGWNDEWNAAHWCEWLVFDIMGDLVFGKAFGMLESPVNRFATQLVGNAAHRHLIVSSSYRTQGATGNDADQNSAARISPSITGIWTRFSSARSLASGRSTCSTARGRPWSAQRWASTSTARTSSTTS
jgi:hypothetical protein